MLRHHAALVSGKLTRVTSGVNLPPLEVIMSRLPHRLLPWRHPTVSGSRRQGSRCLSRPAGVAQRRAGHGSGRWTYAPCPWPQRARPSVKIGGRTGISLSGKVEYQFYSNSLRSVSRSSRYVMYRSRWAIRSRNTLFSASACSSRASNRAAK
jgi:hypothetical protein